MKRKLNVTSKRQVIVILLIFVVPLIGFFIAYNFVTVNTLNEKIAESNLSTLHVYQENLSNELNTVEKYMINMTAINMDFQQLINKRSSLDAYRNAYAIGESYKTILNMHAIVSGLYIYSGVNEIFRSAYNDGLGYMEKVAVEEYLRSQLSEEETLNTRDWFTVKLSEEYYLIRILGTRGTYTISTVRLEGIRSITDFNSTSEGCLLIASKSGQAITCEEAVTENGINLRVLPEDYYISGETDRYMIVQEQLGDLDFSLVYLVPHHGVLYYMDLTQELLIIASILIVLLIPVCYLMLLVSYFRPLSKLVKEMNRIKEGKADMRVENNYSIREFGQFCETLNEMMEQVRFFKIAAYEKELASQKAQLQYLQLQIRPHFFLNCLKSIYGMAEEDKGKEIQETILALSMNYRYLMRDSFALVPLSQEVKNVENYVSLQRMGRICKITCSADIPSNLEEFLVPPISVLTFVENSVKHGMYHDKPLDIFIKARLIASEDGDFVNITISDTGKGFSEEDVKRLNFEEDKNPGDHIGITNVKQRLSIIYDHKSSIAFSNQANGACVEIFIPCSCESEDSDGSVDCG